MSRTYKDKPSKILHESWNKDMIWTGSGYLHLPTTKTKKRKEVDTEWHWMSTPSWWTKMTMIKPERVKANMLSRRAVTEFGSMLDWIDIPDTRRKPHIYYY